MDGIQLSQNAFCTLLSKLYRTKWDVQGMLYYKVHVLLLYVHAMYVVFMLRKMSAALILLILLMIHLFWVSILTPKDPIH